MRRYLIPVAAAVLLGTLPAHAASASTNRQFYDCSKHALILKAVKSFTLCGSGKKVTVTSAHWPDADHARGKVGGKAATVAFSHVTSTPRGAVYDVATVKVGSKSTRLSGMAYLWLPTLTVQQPDSAQYNGLTWSMSCSWDTKDFTAPAITIKVTVTNNVGYPVTANASAQMSVYNGSTREGDSTSVYMSNIAYGDTASDSGNVYDVPTNVPPTCRFDNRAGYIS